MYSLRLCLRYFTQKVFGRWSEIETEEGLVTYVAKPPHRDHSSSVIIDSKRWPFRRYLLRDTGFPDSSEGVKY